MTIIDYYFGRQSQMGSFESTICKAWVLATWDSRHKLEKAFPEHFPTHLMYGTPFGVYGTTFQDYPNEESLRKALKGRLIKLNRWGGEETAILTTWEEIKKRGFKIDERLFNSTYDNRQVLQFNKALVYPNDGIDLSFVTYETLDEIKD